MANSKSKKPGVQTVLAAPLNSVSFAQTGTNVVSWDYGTIPAGETVIWTFVQYGTEIGTNGLPIITGSISVHEIEWLQATGNYKLSQTFNTASDSDTRSLAPGNYFMRVSGSNGDPTNAAQWNIFATPFVPVTIS